MSTDTSISELTNYTTISPSRLQSLYSDLARQRASNPASFHANVAWWKATLEALATRARQPDTDTHTPDADVLVLHAGPALAARLRHPRVGTPLGLAAAIAELRRTRALLPLGAFLAAPRPIDAARPLAHRAAAAAAAPLWWVLQQLALVDPGDGGGEGDGEGASEAARWRAVAGPHVLRAPLERAADAVLARHRARGGGGGLADALYSFDAFRGEYGRRGAVLPGVALSDTDLRVVLKYLSRDRKALAVDKDVIKFLDSGAVQEITAVDAGVLELKTGVQSLEAHVDELQVKIQDRTEKTAAALRAKRKDVALTHLRSRRLLEDALAKRLRALEVLQGTLAQVEMAAGDIEIVKQYQSSTATLRALLAHPALQRGAVEETMDAMAAAAAAQREVADAMRVGAEMALDEAGVDEGALEAELAGLVAEARAEAEAEAGAGAGRREAERAAALEALAAPQTQPAQAVPISGDAAASRGPGPELSLAPPGSDPEWEARWQSAQADKAAQAVRDREAEVSRRARWEAEEQATL